MSQLKGEMIFSVRPDYNQNVNDSRRVIPDIEYKFGFDQDNGMELSVEEIHFHFNKFLRSLGYQIDVSDFENFEDEDMNEELEFDDDTPFLEEDTDGQ